MRPIERDCPDHAASLLTRVQANSGFWRLLWTLAPELAERVSDCGSRQRLIVCDCRPRWVNIPCGQKWLCDACRDRYYFHLRHRLTHGLSDKPKGFFLTLTTRHCGSPDIDRETIRANWERWRGSAYKRYGKKVPYVGVWEVTDSDGGHVHLHVFYHLAYARARSYDDWRRWWLASGHAEWIGIKKAYGTASERARYLAKYLTKGAYGLDDKQMIDTAISWKHKRMYTASEGYWSGVPDRVCRRCDRSFGLATITDRFDIERGEYANQTSI